MAYLTPKQRARRINQLELELSELQAEVATEREAELKARHAAFVHDVNAASKKHGMHIYFHWTSDDSGGLRISDSAGRHGFPLCAKSEDE
jgi:hypothetical protein